MSGGPALVVANERHDGAAPHQGTVVAPEQMLEMAAVAHACGQLADLSTLDGRWSSGSRRAAVPAARRSGSRGQLLERRVRFEDPAVERVVMSADRAASKIERNWRSLVASADSSVLRSVMSTITPCQYSACRSLVLARRGLLADPDDVPVLVHHPVLGEERRERARAPSRRRPPCARGRPGGGRRARARPRSATRRTDSPAAPRSAG